MGWHRAAVAKQAPRGAASGRPARLERQLLGAADGLVDGTKMKANASRHKAMSYGRLRAAEPALAAEVARWLRHAAAADKAEDGAPTSGATRCRVGLPTKSAAKAGIHRLTPGRVGKWVPA